jgi:hypothetical protein
LSGWNDSFGKEYGIPTGIALLLARPFQHGIVGPAVPNASPTVFTTMIEESLHGLGRRIKSRANF